MFQSLFGKGKRIINIRGFLFGMALFGKKKEKTVDFTNRMVRQRERSDSIREGMRARPAAGPRTQVSPGSANQESSNSFNASGNSFGFLDSVASSGDSGTSYSQPTYQTYGSSSASGAGEEDERKRKLAKRLMDITDKLEEISNQLYHLQQRVEVLEKKNNSGFGY